MEDLTPFGVGADPVRRRARYDPLWALPMCRRNEIILKPYTPLTMPSP
jgi:hypothetical protein